MFLRDIYHEQGILKDGIIPAELVLENATTARRCRACACRRRTYAPSPASTSSARASGEFYVLEDNLRTPSGVSYMLENRKMMMRLFPEVFGPTRCAGRPLPDAARHAAPVAPHGVSDPVVVLLTPGAYNSAYFEHTFLAQQMGIELVEGRT